MTGTSWPLNCRTCTTRWVVIATFDTEADHERYQVSEVHTQMKSFMGPHIAGIVVCDVDTPGMGNREG